MADRDAAGIVDDLQIRLDAMQSLDEILGRVLPTGSVDVDGPAQAFATELFLIARRTFGTIRLIMDWTINSADTDRTEDAAALLRRLLELYARAAFVVADSEDWDANALRCELSAARDLEVAMRDVLEASTDGEHARRHAEMLSEIADMEKELVLRVGEAKKAPSTTDILRKIGYEHVLLWRQSSDVLHAGVVGRALQRDGLTLGVPATPERQLFVMDTAMAVMGDLARCWVRIFGEDQTELEAFGEEHNARIKASAADS